MSTSQPKSAAKLSDVLEAIAGWSLEQKQQLGAALGLSSSIAAPGLTSTGYRPPVPAQQGAPRMGGAYTPMSNPPRMGYYSQPPVPPQPVFATPHPEQSFQFGSSNTVNNIRVSTFSGSSKDCYFEQFRYDGYTCTKYILFNTDFKIKEHFHIFGEMVQKPWKIRKYHLFFVKNVCMLIECWRKWNKIVVGTVMYTHLYDIYVLCKSPVLCGVMPWLYM